MANFSPTVNTRGAVFTYPAGLVLRSTYHVFRLYTELVGGTVVDSWCADSGAFAVMDGGAEVLVPNLDIVATSGETGDAVSICIANRNAHARVRVEIEIAGIGEPARATARGVTGPSPDACNDIQAPHRVSLGPEAPVGVRGGRALTELPPHSVHVVRVGR